MRKTAISVIGGADGPTSIFLCGHKEKNIFRRLQAYYRNKKYRRRRERAVKQIVPGEHTIEETIFYMKERYGAVEAGSTYPHYEERRANMRSSLIRRKKPELFDNVPKIEPPQNFDDSAAVKEWMKQIETQEAEYRRIAEAVSNEAFSTDYHLFLIDKAEFGKMEIETDTFSEIISISYSGNEKKMAAVSKDIYGYYGVSQDDIEHKTERYLSLVAVLSN